MYVRTGWKQKVHEIRIDFLCQSLTGSGVNTDKYRRYVVMFVGNITLGNILRSDKRVIEKVSIIK